MQTAALGADLAFLAGRPVTQEQCEAITNGSDKSHESKEVLECDERLGELHRLVLISRRWMEPQERSSKPKVCAAWAEFLPASWTDQLCTGTLDSSMLTPRFRCLVLELNPTQGVQWICCSQSQRNSSGWSLFPVSLLFRDIWTSCLAGTAAQFGSVQTPDTLEQSKSKLTTFQKGSGILLPFLEQFQFPATIQC